MDIKKAMVDYRARNGLSMEKAAVKAGVATQTWMHVERGLQDPSRLTEAKIRSIINESKEGGK